MNRSGSVLRQARENAFAICCNCGSTKDIQWHHIVPLSVGGRDIPSNLVPLCPDCHSLIHHGENGKQSYGELVRAGIAAAKAKGTYNGGKRPADYEKVMRLIAEESTMFNADANKTENEIATLAGVKYGCYCKCKKMLLEDMEKDVWPHAWKKPVRLRNRPMYDGQIKRIRGYD